MRALIRKLTSAIRRSPIRCLILLALVTGGVAAGLAYRRFTDPEHVRAQAEALFQRFAHGRVRVGSATFSLFDGIHLFDVSVAGASPADQSTPQETSTVFSCPEILISHDPVSALWGRLSIQSVLVVEPIGSIVHDPSQGTTNIAGLFQDDLHVANADRALPTIELRNARIHIVYRDGVRQRMVDNITLTLRGRPSQQNPQLYEIVWQGEGDTAGGGHSQVDLSNGYLRNVSGGLPSLSIETVMLAVSAGYDGAGAWCDLLGLDGRVRARDYNLTGGMGAHEERSATIDLHDAALSIPIHQEERGLAADQRYLRFEHVEGTVLVSTDAIHAEFTGKFHGSQCKVSATMRGGVEKLATLDDVDFAAQLTVTELKLPRSDEDAPVEQIRFIHRFPQLVKFYRDYDPHGVIDVDIEAQKRAGSDEPIVVRRVLVTARGGDASECHFPYRVSNLKGAVEYRPDGVWIRHVCGEHDGGIVCVDGQLDRPNACAASELIIKGVGVPMDDQLDRGLETRYREFKDQLRPEGRLDVEIALSRPECRDGEPEKYRSQTSVRFDDLSVGYAAFPYPVNHLSGELRVHDDRMEIVGVEGKAGEAGVHVNGHVALNDSDSKELDVTIVAEGAEFDDRLLAALPEAIRSSVAALNLTGRFDLQTSLSFDPDTQQIVPRSEVTLRGASVRPDSFPAELTDLEGRVRVEPSSIAIDEVVGRYRGATVSASGVIGTEGIGSNLELAIHCRDLQIDDELRNAAPSKLREALADWSVDGPIGADILVRRDAAEGDNLTYNATAELDGVNVRHSRFPIPFEDVYGTMSIKASGVRGNGFRGRYGAAEVQFDFDTDESGDGTEAKIVLKATGLPLDGNVRGLLPERMRGAWDRAGFQGYVDVHCNELNYRKIEGSPQPTWQVDGRIDLQQVDALSVAGLEDMSGTLTLSGTVVDRLGGATLGGDLRLATARLHSRTLSDVASAWSLVRSTDGSGRISFSDTHAAIYGGALAGQAELLFGPDRMNYDLTATVHGMQIEPWLLAGRSGPSLAAANDKAATQVRGTADAYLYLSGEVGDALSRRGGGQLDVQDGYIYRLPIFLAILNVLDLSVPNDDALHELEADFFVLGNRMNLESISLRGGSLTLVGSGSMSLPDQAVDLRLVKVGGRSWARVPVLSDLVEGAAKELVELRVTGPISSPTVRAQPLRALTDELKKLFQKKPPRKIVGGGS